MTRGGQVACCIVPFCKKVKIDPPYYVYVMSNKVYFLFVMAACVHCTILRHNSPPERERERARESPLIFPSNTLPPDNKANNMQEIDIQ